MRVGITTSLAALMLLTFAITTPAYAAQTLQPIDETDTVWIVGTDVNGYGCWSLGSTKTAPTLQVKVGGKWITKAKAKLTKNASLCTDAKYPWVATYHWYVDELGEIPHGGNLARDIMAREFLPKSGNATSFAGNVFVKQVYRSQADLMADYSNTITSSLGGGSVSSSSSSKFAGCYFKGKKLFGKVQIVDMFPDIKVQVVDMFPDLKVQKVDMFPNSCGQWQIVDMFPDIKVQFVNMFPDIKVQFVDMFPGLTR